MLYEDTLTLYKKKGGGLSNICVSQRESYPALDIVAAKAAMDHIPAAVCEYSLHGMTVGQLFIPTIMDNSIIVHHLFSMPYLNSGPQEELLRTKTVSTKFDILRRFLMCPTCGHFYWKLYFNNGWGCARCHRLHYRSQLIDKEVALWEQRDALEERLKRGRPKGMHNSTFALLKDELRELEQKLQGKARKYASDVHEVVLHSRWVPGSEADLWSPSYTVRLGDFVRVTDLQ